MLGHFGTLAILSSRHLENSKCRKRLSLNSPHLPKHTCSKRNSVLVNPLPERFINQGEKTLVTEEETGNWHRIHTSLVTNCHTSRLSFPAARSSVLKIICSLLTSLDSSPFSLLRFYLSWNSKPPQRVTHFSWVSPMGTRAIHVNKLLLPFLMSICLSLQRS